jgi:hypothetical protein
MHACTAIHFTWMRPKLLISAKMRTLSEEIKVVVSQPKRLRGSSHFSGWDIVEK